MIKINAEKCIGCGECKIDCFPGCIEIEDKKAVLKYDYRCMRCGHCVAVCPAGAVTDDSWETPESSGDGLLDFMMMRRTVRRFTSEEVSQADIDKIIRAGQYSPTARNSQDNEFIVIRGDMREYQRIGIDTLAASSEAMKSSGGSVYRTSMFERWKEDFARNPDNCEHLFFRAPLVILVTGNKNDLRDAACAGAYMELQAFSLGLGVLYSGFFCRAVDYSPELRAMLGISEDRAPARCLVIGHPDVRYHRPAPRKPAQIKDIKG
ncbi:MAG: nitroreductase family protein [Oscillospiraceae bacterium]|nr:nitroreductase family protein [Oscillospiraceae bacterium]